jgi:hypothetical protein
MRTIPPIYIGATIGGKVPLTDSRGDVLIERG